MAPKATMLVHYTTGLLQAFSTLFINNNFIPLVIYKYQHYLYVNRRKRVSVWERFISQYESDSTIHCYEQSVKSFVRAIYRENADLKKSVEEYFAVKKNNEEYEDDVKKFYVTIKDKSPSSIQVRLSVVRSLLIDNHIDLGDAFWRRIRRHKRGPPISGEEVPTNEQLRRIMSHMNVKGKALFTVLASSGMRIGEALSFGLDDINFETEPTRIKLRAEYTKSKAPRTAFITTEATEILKEWLRGREEYLVQAAARSKPRPHYQVDYKGKSLDDKRVFSFDHITAYFMWNNALDQTKLNGVDKNTNRHVMHVHTLRKFCRTRLGTVLSQDVAEALIGHERYLSSEYRRFSDDELGKFYKQAEATLGIFCGGSAEEVQSLKKEAEGLAERMHRIESENELYKTLLKQLEEKIKRGEERFGVWEEFLPDIKEMVIAHRQWKEEVKEKERIRKRA
jgi:integrase